MEGRRLAGRPNLEALANLVAEPRSSAFLLDFDGTLAPIVDNPELARPLPRALAALERLRGALGCVGIISGRPLEFLTPIVPSGLDLAGLDGLQRSVGGIVVEDPRVRAFAPLVESVAEEAAASLPEVLVERKKNVSVAIHWRTNRGMAGSCLEFARRIAVRHGLHVQHGRMMVELRPMIPMDKGVTTRDFVHGYEHVAFAGDDATDLVAFEALVDLRRTGKLHSVALVAVRNDEQPDALIRMADVAVDGPHGIASLLEGVADALEEGGRA